MVQIPTNPDVIVIGAGAAGIGAGLELMRRNVSFIILEAKQRIGGRAYSETSSLGHLWDQGCHWFHSADKNVLRAEADRLGHAYRPPSTDFSYNTFSNGAWQAANFRDDYVWRLLAEISDKGAAADVSAESLLDRAHPWYPMIRHWCQLMYSQDPEQISARDAHNYRDTHVNLAVEAGYGNLIARMAEGLPVRFGTPVSSIAVTGSGASVTTEAGTLDARAVILAVPARMIERGRITITPGLPQHVEQAFHDVPMGHYEKVGIAFDGPVLDRKGATYADIFDPVAPDTQPLNVEVHPFGRSIAVSHLAGSAIASARPQDLIALVEDALVRAYGSAIRSRITRRAVTSWTADPFINGAYSCAKPGKADARGAFLEPVHGRLLLAGEHVHQHFFATAHGAYETGVAAAKHAARLLGRAELAGEPGLFA